MEEIKNKELERLLADVEKYDWIYTIYQEPEGTYNKWYCNERNYVELEKYSPAGEDFSMIINFDIDNPIDTFLNNLGAYSRNFDIDEHVEIWIPDRGKGGCPGSISELVEDAEAIRDMIVELWKNLDCTITEV